MARRDDLTLVRDMLDAAQSALTAIEGCEFTALSDNYVWTLGLVKCLEIIGEAAGRTSTDFRTQHAAIPWPVIIGMRNRLVHAYFAIDYEEVWQTLIEDLPPLVVQIEAILAAESTDRS